MGYHALLQGDLPDPGIEPTSLMSPALAGGFFTTSTTWASYYMDTSQIGLGPTYMTLFNCDYLFEDSLPRESHSEVMGVRISTQGWGAGVTAQPLTHTVGKVRRR